MCVSSDRRGTRSQVRGLSADFECTRDPFRAIHNLLAKCLTVDGVRRTHQARIHVKERFDRTPGATVVARHAGEMINEITFAMAAGIGLRTL